MGSIIGLIYDSDIGDLVAVPAIKDVHEWDRENIWLLGTGQVGDVSIQRNLLNKLASW